MSRLGWLLVSLVSACSANAPAVGGGGGTPDAPDVPGDSDGSAATTLRVSGKTIDYFGNVNLQSALLATDGIDPAVTSTSSANDATYALDVPFGSKLYVIATKLGYRPTRNVAIATAEAAVVQDLFGLSTVDVNRQYTTLGKTATTGTAVIIADLRKADGSPVTGIPPTNVQLLDAQNQPVPGILGPYFFGSAGDIDPAATTSAAYGTPARVRAMVLDVPPGTYSLAVTYPDGAGNTQNNTPVVAAADGGVLALSGGSAAPAPGATDPHFAQDIYPRLQRAAAGGLGCANCHTAGGAAAVLRYDDPADTVLANIRAAAGVIDTTTPTASLFLVRPLYEQPPAAQDHPNATFLDTNDPDYKQFLLWITNGTKP